MRSMGAKRKKSSGEPSVVRRAGGVLAGGGFYVLRRVGMHVSVVLLYVAGVWCLWQYSARRQVLPDSAQTDASACPWLSPRDVAEINSTVQFGPGASLYDRDVCRRVAESYAGNAWIDRVDAVRRRFPDRVEVELAVRRPFACVRRAGRYYLIDSKGCRLPVSAGRSARDGYPSIEGVTAAPPAAGEAWADDSLPDPLRLIKALNGVLEGRGAGMKLVRVEVAPPAPGAYDDKPQLVAYTASGMEIDWGSYRQSRIHAIPDAEQKLAELERVLDAAPDPESVAYVCVRFLDGYIRPGRPARSAAGNGH